MKLLAFLFLIFLCSVAHGQENSNFYIDSFSYEDNVYSKSKKTELGDQTVIELSAKYIYKPGTFARLSFETTPEENRENNETSKFEFLLGHQYENIVLSLDLELQTNKSTSGGTFLGLDLDSESTFINWKINPKFSLTFYPFNFDGEVGEEFATWDVTRIKTIEGAPSTVSNTVTGSEKIVEKTIPGIILGYNSDVIKGLSAYAGYGIASYFYPTNKDFDLRLNTSAISWERKEDHGYKAGLTYKRELLELKAEFVGHDSSDETGSLLEYAGSFYGITAFSNIVMDGEFTLSKAGSAPWYSPRGTTWFETTSPFRKVYSDYFGNNKQDWTGKSDFAAGLRVGYKIDHITPYLLYRYQGEHFIYIENESAHLLRTADESLSHGGLNRFGAGVFVSYGKWNINPELEIRNASNPVFSNAADVRNNRLLSTYRKTDYLLSLFVTYEVDASNLFYP